MLRILTTDKKVVAINECDEEYEYNVLSDQFSEELIELDSLPDYLRNEYDIIVIDSLKSGKGRNPKKDFYKHVIHPLFQELKIAHEYFPTTSKESISRFAKELPISNKYTLIFLSGDTSISEFVNGVDFKDRAAMRLFNFPLGTGNAFCHSLGIHTVLEGIRRLLTGSTKPFNIFTSKFSEDSYLIQDDKEININSYRFFVVTSWALHSTLVADSDTPEMRKYGVDRFKMAASKLLELNPLFHGKFKIINKETGSVETEVNGPFGYFVIAALPRFEEKFVISPRSVPSDSSLHIVHFPHQEFSETTLKIMGEAYDNGAHVNNPAVGYIKVTDQQSILLEVHEDDDYLSRICVDGSIIVLKNKDSKLVSIEWADNVESFHYIS